MAIDIFTQPFDAVFFLLEDIDALSTNTNPTVTMRWEDGNVGPYIQDGATSTLVTEMFIKASAQFEHTGDAEVFHLTNGTLVPNETNQVTYDTVLRGIPNGEVANPPVATRTDLYREHKADRVWLLSEVIPLKSLTSSLENVVVNPPVVAGEAIDASTAGMGVSLHTDGNYYIYDSTNYPNLQGVIERGDVAAIGGGFELRGLKSSSIDHTGLTPGALYYVDDGGVITTTASATTTFLGKAKDATTIDHTVDPGVQSLTDPEILAGTDTTPKLVTAAQLATIGDGGNVEVEATVLGGVNPLEPVMGLDNDITSSDSASIQFGRTTTSNTSGTEIYVPLIGTGAAIATLTVRMTRIGNPAGNIVARIETDNNFSPSGTLVAPGASDTVPSNSVTASPGTGDVTFGFSATTLDDQTVYWLVLDRDSANDNTNYFFLKGALVPLNSNDHFYTVFLNNGGFQPVIQGGSRMWANVVSAGIKSGTSGLLDSFVRADANIWDIDNVMGLSQDTIANGGSGTVLLDGVQPGHTGLSPWAYYQVDATPGGLATATTSTASNFQAISATDLKIKKPSTNKF